MSLGLRKRMKIGSGKEQGQPGATGEGENHAQGHDGAAAQVEHPLAPGLGSQQTGPAQGDGQQKVLAQHVGVVQGGGDPEVDAGEHVAVHPGGGLIAPAEDVLEDSVEGDHRPRQHHQDDEGVQLPPAGDRVVEHHGEENEGHGQKAGLQAGRAVHREEGARQIDGGVQDDIPVDGGVDQRPAADPAPGSEAGRRIRWPPDPAPPWWAAQGPAPRAEHTTPIPLKRHCRQTGGLNEENSRSGTKCPGTRTTAEENAAPGRRLLPEGRVEEPLNYAAALPLAAEPQAHGHKGPPQHAGVQNLFDLLHSLTSLSRRLTETQTQPGLFQPHSQGEQDVDHHTHQGAQAQAEQLPHLACREEAGRAGPVLPQRPGRWPRRPAAFCTRSRTKGPVQHPLTPALHGNEQQQGVHRGGHRRGDGQPGDLERVGQHQCTAEC